MAQPLASVKQEDDHPSEENINNLKLMESAINQILALVTQEALEDSFEGKLDGNS